MSKDLQAIKYLNDTCINFLDRTKELYCTVTFTRKRAEILRDNIAEVEQALNRLEAIDNANPSEALECLEKLTLLTCNIEWYKDNINTIKQALLKAEKEHKALEIIKKKIVDIRWIEVYDTVKDYNKGRDEHLNYELSKEEFNLLKEILGC